MAMPPGGIPDFPMQVQVDPNEDTEWNDILRKHKIIPEKPPSPTKELEEALLAEIERAEATKLDHATLEDLDELEDWEDEALLESRRRQLFAEMDKLQRAAHGSVYGISKADWARDVTEASQKCVVVVLLTGEGTPSKVVAGLWPRLARRWPDVKFCQAKANLCFDKHYPEKNCPTLIAYKDGDLLARAVGLEEIGGLKQPYRNIRPLELWLSRVGAVEKSDARLKTVDDEDEDEDEGKGSWLGNSGKGTANKNAAEDSDSDWDL